MPAFDLLAYYADTYKMPLIPQPLFVKNRVAKAEVDECYDNGTVGVPDEFDNCTTGDPKTNQAYIWGMARSGNLWFGTVANTQCLIIGGLAQGMGLGLPTIEAENFVCEFSEADNATNSLGDWRPPQILEYDPETFMVTDRTPQDLFDNPTLGIRSAGAIDGVVLLAGPSLAGDAVNVFAFSDNGTYLGMDVLTEYNDIRQWVVHDGVMYTGVQKTTAAGSDYKGRILRYDGLSFEPFQINFEVVGKIDLEAANMTVHRNRLFVTTWPSLSVMSLSPYVSGLWMSPEILEGGLTGSDNESWQKVWSVTDYEPDMIVARTYGGGALASYEGTLFWGTMHVPMTGTLAAILAADNGLINLKGIDNETMGPEDIVATALGTHRATSIFSSTFETDNSTIELLYGDEYLPVYDPESRSYTIDTDNSSLHRNRMPNPVPKFGPSGLGNFFNAYTWTMDVGFENNRSGGVLLGTFDWSFMARDLTGIILEQLVDDGTDVGMALDLLMMVFDGFMEGYSYGADLFVIQDPDVPFILESSNGAGNYLNYGIRTMLMPDSVTMNAPVAMDEDQCGLGYFGMANPFNLAEDGGWELIQLYPLPELALVAPTAQEFVMGDFTLQAQDLSACPLGSVEFIISNVFAQTYSYSAAYNSETGLWEATLPTTQFANGIYFVLTSGSDADGVPAVSLPQVFIIDNDCRQDSDCDDGLYCTGIETCDTGNGTCVFGEEPCVGDQLCDEDNATCVECLETGDCEFGYVCEQTAGVCDVLCPLTVETKKDKPIIVKPGKDKKVKLFITGGEGFDPYGVFDAGPFEFKKRKYKEKKGVLQIKITIPAGLESGTYQISVGECLGEVTFTEAE